MTVSSRIAVMNHGRIAQVATPTEIYEYPNSRYVAEFIGDVNVFEGRLTDVAPDHVTIHAAEADANIYVDRGTSAAPGATVWVAVRPEKIDVALSPPPDPSWNCVTGTVWDIGYLGNLTIYHVRLGNGKKVTAAVANRTRLRDRPITWNDEVYLTWAPDSAVVLVS